MLATMTFSRIPLLLALTHIQLVASEQPSAPSPISAPLRELPWGQLNFLHTTDTHGWFAGHLGEPQYSADWGDYISFAHHLRKRADDDGSDLLVIDTGDRVEGNGLYDASNPKGNYTVDIIKEQQIDVICSGNHELYQHNTSDREYLLTVPNFKNSYIASNLDIHDPESKDGKLVPLAPRYRKFTTKNQGIRILAFGFMFDFHGNYNNTVLQPVEETVKEDWFQDAIREKDVDLILVAGHVPVRNGKEFDLIYNTIRKAKWDTPIVFFGGHTHVRDYRKWDKKAYGLESGRYMETLGFLSISGLSSSDDKADGAAVHATASPDYKRLYIDNNLFSIHHHSKTNESTFSTKHGKNVSSMIRNARKDLKLDHTFGCAPKTLWLNRAPYPSNDSMLTWLDSRVLPDAFESPNATKSIIVSNTGALRFDIFKGPFTVDSTFLVSPFTSGFKKIRNVPYKAASQVLRLLNNEGPIPLKDILAVVGEPNWFDDKLDELLPPSPPVNKYAHGKAGTFSEMQNPTTFGQQIPLQLSSDDEDASKDKDKGDKDKDKDKPKVPGYTTSDDDGSDGDDTIHAPIKFYSVPNCVGTNIGFDPDADSKDKEPENVDLIYNEFIQDWVLVALRFAGVRYGAENAEAALDGKTLTAVISDWVSENWKCKD